jgi:hypothetical protein
MLPLLSHNRAEGHHERQPWIGIFLWQEFKVFKISTGLSLDVHRPLERDSVVWAHAGVSGECHPQGFEVHEVDRVTKFGESLP